MRLGADGLSWLNSGLMVASAAAAIVAPYHLFLGAYAILGPLHYLTQISWLHDRGYFAARPAARRLWLLLVAAAVSVITFAYVASEIVHRPAGGDAAVALVYLVFVSAALVNYARGWPDAIAVLALTALAMVFTSRAPAYGSTAFLLLTVVHVFLFTAGFIFYGARKSHSAAGLVSLVVFLACAAAVVSWRAPFLPAGPEARSLLAPFGPLGAELLRLVGRSGDGLDEGRGIGVWRFLAFAYTYHYLNWFSKTSVIRWHEIPRRRGVAIFLLWLAGLALYGLDYRLGFATFYLLSVLHVLLEFPLDHRTFVAMLRPARLPRPSEAV